MDLDLFDPVDIIPKLPADFDAQLVNKKWQDRKSALETLTNLIAENPKLQDNQEYGQLVDNLTKSLGSDSNVNCAAQAAKCLIGLANGLRTKFSQYSQSLPATIFEKFKEKKSTLRDPLVELIDAVLKFSGLAALAPTILEATKKPNPQQKTQLDLFLYRTFRSIAPKDIPKGMLKDLVAALAEHAFDPDPEVRDSSLAALGAIQKCVGEKTLIVFLNSHSKLTGDAAKMAKMLEYKEKAELEFQSMNPPIVEQQTEAPSAAKNKEPQAPQPTAHQQSQEEASQQEQELDLFDPVDILPKLPADFAELIADKKWQNRKTALETLTNLVTENPKLQDNQDYGQLMDNLTRVLGSDSNVNCAAQAAKCLIGLANGLRTKFSQYSQSLPATIFEKFKEKKSILRDPLVDLIDAILKYSGLAALAPTILEATKKPNPQQKAQLDLFLYRTFRSIVPKDIPKGMLKDLVAALAEHAFDPDPEVRDSSLAALGAIQKCIGEKTFIVFLNSHSKLTGDAAKMAKMLEYKEKAEREFPSKNPPTANQSNVVVGSSASSSTPNPVSSNVAAVSQKAKIHSPQTMADQPEEADEIELNETPLPSSAAKNKEQQQAPPPPAHRQAQAEAPRPDLPVDIFTKLPKDFDAQLADKSWQTRQTALDLLNGLLMETPKIADNPEYRQLIEQLTKILATEPNINRAALAAQSLTAFAKGLRAKFFPYAATVAPIVFEKFKEKKAILREPLIDLIDAVFATSNLTIFAPSIMEAATKPNPSQKSQLGYFLFRTFRNLSPKDIPKGLLKELLAALSEHVFDSDPEVRDAGFAAIGAIQKCVGEKASNMYLNTKITGDAAKMARIAEHRDRAAHEASLSPPAAAQQPQAPSSGHPARARSASGTRRSMALPLRNDSVVGAADDSIRTPPRRSHAGMTSAQSHASALNLTFTTPGTGRFQLDPKFFENDFDEPTLTPTGAAKSLNRTFSKGQGPERGILGSKNEGQQDHQQQDLQPIKPVIRPTSTFSRRSESVSSISSLESAEHIDRAVHNVSNLQLHIAEEAIAQLFHLLNDPTNRKYIFDRVELIMKTVITQIFHIRTQHLEQLEAAKEGAAVNSVKEAELSEFMRSICNFLTSLTKEAALMQKINSDTLRGFIDALLTLITDQRLSILNNQVYRSLNIVVIRICDFTNPNSCIQALMKLIIKYQVQEPEGRMMDLIWKCMVKHTDTLADPARVAQVDIPTALEAINAYYSRFFFDREKITESIKQTVKRITIYLQRIVVYKKYTILNFLYPYPENSPMVAYIRRCARALGKRTAEDKTPDDTSIPEDMEKMFARIEEDIFGGAVEELYNFIDVFPEQNANFEQMLARCEYSSIVRKAFVEIRQCRQKKMPIETGVCVHRALPDETRLFLEEQKQFLSRLDDLTKLMNMNSAATVQGSQKSTPT